MAILIVSLITVGGDKFGIAVGIAGVSRLVFTIAEVVGAGKTGGPDRHQRIPEASGHCLPHREGVVHVCSIGPLPPGLQRWAARPAGMIALGTGGPGWAGGPDWRGGLGRW